VNPVFDIVIQVKSKAFVSNFRLCLNRHTAAAAEKLKKSEQAG
jgi:hypothetical protein